jgi:hypothetical protein
LISATAGGEPTDARVRVNSPSCDIESVAVSGLALLNKGRRAMACSARKPRRWRRISQQRVVDLGSIGQGPPARRSSRLVAVVG